MNKTLKKALFTAQATVLAVGIMASTTALAASADGVWTSGGFQTQTSFGMPAHSASQLGIVGTDANVTNSINLFKYLYNSNTVAFDGVTYKDFYDSGKSENTIKEIAITNAADQATFAASLSSTAGKYKITYSVGRNVDGKFEAFKDVDGKWTDSAQLDASSYDATTKTNIKANLAVSKTSYGTHMGAASLVTYLESNFGNQSFVLPSLVSKDSKWMAGSLKELNDLGSSVFFGANFVPSGQSNAFRGDYNSAKQLVVDGVLKKIVDVTAQKGATETATIDTYVDALTTKDSYTAEIKAAMVKSLEYNNAAQKTFGGADIALAKVGGVWDSMLSEGRRFFAFAESDATENAASAKSYTYAKSSSSSDILDGMRSGNSFISMGSLITALDYKITNNTMSATMGETLRTVKGKDTTVTIRFKTGNKDVDHVDLISGEVGSIPNQYVDSSHIALTSFEDPIQYLTKEYQNGDVTGTTKVVKSFSKAEFNTDSDGFSSITVTIPASDKDMYYRLRGTNNAKGSVNCDANGNPTADLDANTVETASSDLWFYSNPVFVNAQADGVTISGVIKDKNGNPLKNTTLELNSQPIYVTTDGSGKFTINNVELGLHTLCVLDANGDVVSEMTFMVQRGTKTEFDKGDIWVENGIFSCEVEFAVDGGNMSINKVSSATNIKSTETNTNPKTGDSSSILSGMILLLACGSIIVLQFVHRKKVKVSK